MSQISVKNESRTESFSMTPFTNLFNQGGANQKVPQVQSLFSYQARSADSVTPFGELHFLRDKNIHLESQLQQAGRLLHQQEERNKQQDKYVKQLRSRIQELERQLNQERQQSAISHIAERPCKVRGGSLEAGKDDSIPVKLVSPIALRNNRSHPQLSSSTLPFASAAFPEPYTNSPAGASSVPPMRRHKRTETPEQLFLKQYTKGRPVYTIGIDPQNDRGLLHDFFEDIRKWASFYAKARLDGDTIEELSTNRDLEEITGGKSDIKHLLMDSKMRQEMVASFVTRHIVTNAMGEHFLQNSGHEGGAACNNLFLEFAHLNNDDFGRKHKLCEKQQVLYTQLKQEPNHKNWRTYKAEENCEHLLAAIAPLLETRADAQRDHVLSELYVKGYRIGFRLRMEAVKWRVMWPTAGTDLNLSMMVNQTRNLLGDPMKTYTGLQKDPKKFFVRFALTPTFSKSDFSSGAEEKTVVHSAMVHVGRKGVFSHKADTAK